MTFCSRYIRGGHPSALNRAPRRPVGRSMNLVNIYLVLVQHNCFFLGGGLHSGAIRWNSMFSSPTSACMLFCAVSSDSSTLVSNCFHSFELVIGLPIFSKSPGYVSGFSSLPKSFTSPSHVMPSLDLPLEVPLEDGGGSFTPPTQLLTLYFRAENSLECDPLNLPQVKPNFVLVTMFAAHFPFDVH